MINRDRYDKRLIGGTFQPDLVIEHCKKDLDRTLYRENLKLTVTERFVKAMALQKSAEELRRSGNETRQSRVIPH